MKKLNSKFRSAHFLLFLALILSYCLKGQDVDVSQHPLYQEVYTMLNDNKPDSFNLAISSYVGNTEDSLVIKFLNDLALQKGQQENSELWKLESYKSRALFHYTYQSFKKALSYVDMAETLAIYCTTDNELWGINMRAMANAALGNSKLAIKYYDDGISLLESISTDSLKNKTGLVFYYNRSLLFYKLNNFPRSLSNCLTSLQYANLDDRLKKKYKGTLLGLLGIIQKEFSSKKAWTQTLSESASYLFQTHTPFDSTYGFIRLLDAEPAPEEAELYFSRGMVIANQYNFKYLKLLLLNGLENVYNLHEMPEENERVVDEILLLYPDDFISDHLIIKNRLRKGFLTFKRNDYDQAEYWSKRSLEESTQLEMLYTRSQSLDLLSKIHAKKKDYVKAYAFSIKKEKISSLIDSTNNLSVLMQQYLSDVHKNELQINSLKFAQKKLSLETKVEKQKKLITIAILSVLFLSILALLLFIIFYQKKKSEKKIQKQRDLLLSINDKLKRFTGIVSHDILSSLDIIISSGRVMITPNSKKAELQEYHHITQSMSVQLKNYCLELLAAAKSENKTCFTSKSEAEAIIQYTLNQFSSKLSEFNFDVKITPIYDLPFLPVILKQILFNGISNCIKYVPQKGKRPAILIGCYTSRGKNTGLYIDDNGPNILRSDKKEILMKKDSGSGLSKLSQQLSSFNLKLILTKSKIGGLRLAIEKTDFT